MKKRPENPTILKKGADYCKYDLLDTDGLAKAAKRMTPKELKELKREQAKEYKSYPNRIRSLAMRIGDYGRFLSYR